jgi:hypothetical protein
MSQCGFFLSCDRNKCRGSEERPLNPMPNRVSAPAPGLWCIGAYAGPPIVQSDERQRSARALAVVDRLEWARSAPLVGSGIRQGRLGPVIRPSCRGSAGVRRKLPFGTPDRLKCGSKNVSKLTCPGAFFVIDFLVSEQTM